MSRNTLIIGVIIIALIGIGVTFPLWSPYFINDVVDEAFPEFTTAELDAVRDMPEDQQTILVEMAS
ncbi:MAG: hypothetical protein AAFV93_25560, partial [Chloroflexota bacterium]